MSAGPAPVPPIPADTLLIFLVQCGTLLLLAVALGRLAARAGLPPVMGELAAGVLAGPSLLAVVWPGAWAALFPPDPAQAHLLDGVAQLATLLLVGATGAQVDLGLVRRRGLTAARVSVAGLVLPLGLGVAAGFWVPATLMGPAASRPVFALFIGVAMCVSAIPVIAKILLDMRLLHRDIGQLTLIAGMIDDVCGWLLLAVVSALATAHGQSVLLPVAALAGVLAVTALARPVVGRVMRAAAASPDPGPPIAAAVTMLLLAGAATHALRLEAILGAFLCGVLIRASGIEMARLAPLNTMVRSVLAPLFFATAGLRMDLTGLADPRLLLTALALLAVAVAGKFAGAWLGALSSRLSGWEALALGAGMNARGIVQIIIAMAGLRLGVLGTEAYTVIVLVAMATSLMAPPILRLAMPHVEHTDEERRREREHLSAFGHVGEGDETRR
ncbi:cation:proton antiporter [Bailinhaonella thermotolerans]|uniref:Cation:proton antiporter n=1 Tax=Bailinhaonella thermotolerans TaxID=1070861 RepID=A0A3A4B004_9ACTN|nr:cation:proton antiporter [Bailinhaonella thermotolerans]RJL27228.1 cation:proton antiporter [Bailinhaonella thermotolerans]